MRRSIATALVLAVLTAGAYGQEAAERYIPIGQSPGVSGISSYVGPVQDVSPGAGTLTVVEGGVTRIVKVTDRTRIYQDYSAEQRSNRIGRLADCRPGQTVEIKFVDAAARSEAEWIKVRMAGH